MSYTCALSLKKIKDYLAGAAVVGFDFETSPIEEYRSEERAALDAHKAAITGVSLSVSEDSGIYIPLRHRAGRNIQKPEAVMDYLRQAVFENATVIKVAHNLAFESMFLYALGVIVQPPCYDTIAAAQLTLKSSTTFRGLSDSGLKTLVPQLFHVEQKAVGAVKNRISYGTDGGSHVRVRQGADQKWPLSKGEYVSFHTHCHSFLFILSVHVG